MYIPLALIICGINILINIIVTVGGLVGNEGTIALHIYIVHLFTLFLLVVYSSTFLLSFYKVKQNNRKVNYHYCKAKGG